MAILSGVLMMLLTLALCLSLVKVGRRICQSKGTEDDMALCQGTVYSLYKRLPGRRSAPGSMEYGKR